jgi:hypothetical protein
MHLFFTHGLSPFLRSHPLCRKHIGKRYDRTEKGELFFADGGAGAKPLLPKRP